MLLVNKESTNHYANSRGGGKGYNLFLLEKIGVTVPEWTIVPWDEKLNFILEHNLNEKIEDLLRKFHNSDLKGDDLESQIESLFLEHALNQNSYTSLKESVSKFFSVFDGAYISVRSSAVGEDGAQHSFAGQLSSFLYIDYNNFDEVVKSIIRCWASAYSARSLSYRKENSLSALKSDDFKVSVILQRMINPDVSGVLFTGNPIQQEADQMLINSLYGVGEGLVSGLYEGDTYVVSKNDLSILSQEIAPKPKALVQSSATGACGPVEIDIDAQKSESSSLTTEQLKSLCQAALKIEEFYQFPQDIEWAIYNDEVYLLQTRPITTEIPSSQGHLWVWDNSNIVESYGGITLPLTFNFAHYVYHQVYVQFCEILMVPQKNIKQMEFFLKNMLGLFYGRVYYNLLNWYKLTSILPGYKFNRQFMETMMGTSESLQDEIADRVKPPAFHRGAFVAIKKAIVGIKFFYFHLTIQSIVDNFLDYFNEKYKAFQKRDYSLMPADQIYSEYRELERTMLWKWHAPIINDFLCMVHFGIFKKLTEKWLAKLGDNFHNDLLAGNGNLESAEPTKRLMRLAEEIDQRPQLRELIFKTPNDLLVETIRQSEFQDFYHQIEDYLEKYGFRCMSEMKLEQRDLHHDPSLFFVFLKNILNSPNKSVEELEKREKKIREAAEESVSQSISGLRALIYRWSLHHTRKAVMNRENTRFCRTRVYGIVRAMFYGIGADFTRRNLIDCEEDIFYLSLEELTGSLEGTSTIQNLRAIIELRKKEYATYEEVEEPAARFYTRGPVYWNNQHHEKQNVEIDTSELKENQMKGLGCCPGVIEGTVKVILSPDDNLELNGEILVTSRTDPGWIPLYPSASGLLVERGGLLSHSAIVAREMGLPTIVSIKGLTKKLESGMRIRMNGEDGLIEILEE